MNYYSLYLVKGKSSWCNILNATFIPQNSESQRIHGVSVDDLTTLRGSLIESSRNLGKRLTDVTWINNRRFIEDSWMTDIW